jgi:hypothetical protein
MKVIFKLANLLKICFVLLLVPSNEQTFTTRNSLAKMSHLTNPLVAPEQLIKHLRNHPIPQELREGILYYSGRLTQAAGVLLRLPQSITAQANVLLFRFWTVVDIMEYEFAVSFPCEHFYAVEI